MMKPAGYMAKNVARADFLKAPSVTDIYSVSGCISKYFCDYINYWKHNGYWLFNSPSIIRALAEEHHIDLSKTVMFYYEVYELEYDEKTGIWKPFEPETSFGTNVEQPEAKTLEGFDLVSFFGHTNPECSYLSCNLMAQTISTNAHCLIPTFERAKDLLQRGVFKDCEPGPVRIFAVYTLSSV